MSLREEREAIGALLGGHPSIPERVTPPTTVLQAGSPYLTPGSTYGRFLARWEALVIGRPGASPKVQDDLDDAADDAVVALVNDGLTVESVSQPYRLVINQAHYPTVQITFTKEIDL